MDRDPKSNGQRIANQSTYPRFVGMYLCQEFGEWVSLWQILANPPLVQAENWEVGFYPDFASELVARRM